MAKTTVRAAEQKEFVRIFDGVCNWNSVWERWNDMVILFSDTILNSVDLNHREKREAEYQAVARKYKPEELAQFSRLFGEMVEQLERNPFQDFLGSMYMELGIGSSMHGQFFTPFGVCQMMASTSLPEKVVREQLDRHGYISIHDCACGAGATLIAAAERLHEMGVNYQERALFTGQDLDTVVARMCYIQLSMIGCAGHVRIGDSLMNPDTYDILLGDGTEDTWILPTTYLSQVWQGRLLARYFDRYAFRAPKQARKQPPDKEPQQKSREVKQHGPKPGGSLQLSFFE